MKKFLNGFIATGLATALTTILGGVSTAQAARPVKVMHASRVKPNGTIHQHLVSAKSMKAQSAKAQSLSATPQPNASSSSVSGVNPDKSLLAPFGALFAQVAKDQLLLTVDESGAYHPFFYINNYLGYADPVTGDLLYCSDYKPRDQFITVSATDCQIDGSIWDISKTETYGNGRYIVSSSGDTMYYEDGKVLKDYYGNWFYSDGVTKAFDGYYKNLYYSNNQKAYDAYYGDFYHPSGAKLFDNYYNEMRYSNGALFVDADLGYAYYADGNDLRRYYQDTNSKYVTYFKYPNQNNIANFKTDDRADIFYPSGYTLKHDVNPFDGNIFNENGSIASSFVNYEYTLPSGLGYVDVDADHVSDIVVATLTDSNTYFFAINSRVRPGVPPNVANLVSSSRSLRELGVTWDSGGYPTDSFQISLQSGSVNNASCIGGNYLTGATRSYKFGSLNPDSTYTIAVCALNSLGERGPSRSVVVKTLPIVYPPKVTNLTATKVLSNRISLSWSSGGGNTLGYRYVIAASGQSLPACSSGIDNGSSTSASIYSVKAATTYTVGVCAYESSGYLSGSTTLSVKTPAVVVPPAITSLVTSSDLNRVSLSWKSGGGNTYSYTIARRKGYGDVACTSPASVASVTTSATAAVSLTNLAAGTRFTFAICATAEDGTLSAPVTIRASTYSSTTLPLPPVPTNLTGSRVSKNIVLNWSSGGGSTTGFVWAYANKGKAAAVTCSLANAQKLGNVKTLTIKNANAKKPYIIALCAVNAAGKLSAPTKFRVEIK